MGDVLAVGVVQKSENVPLPLIFDVCGGSRDDSRSWLLAMGGGRERAQPNLSICAEATN